MKIRDIALVLLGCGLVAASCQPPPVQGREHPALRNYEIRKVAVAPLAVSPRIPAQTPGGTTPDVAATIVAHQLAEALAARGIEVVAPSDVGRALEVAGEDPAQLRPLAAAEVVARKFGADAILTGTLIRWVERRGSGRAVSQVPAVGFEVVLRASPGAQRLWSATFNESQKPLGENVLITSQYPGGGTRWLTTEELARWGAGVLVKAVPLP